MFEAATDEGGFRQGGGWATALDFPGSRRRPVELISPTEYDRVLGRLANDPSFARQVLNDMLRMDTKHLLPSRWDSAGKIDRRRNRERVKARALLREQALSNVKVAPPPLPDGATSSTDPRGIAGDLLSFVSTDNTSNFLSHSRNPAVKPVYGVIRPQFQSMKGIFAIQGIAEGSIVLSWCGVIVSVAEFKRVESQIVNYEDVMEYAMEYEIADGTDMVVCPQLSADGMPDEDGRGYLDSCWASLVNEPMTNQRARINESGVISFKTKTRNKANCRIVAVDGRPVILACENIAKGDEITMRYTLAKFGSLSYSRGKYRPGDHASQKKCPAPKIRWSDAYPRAPLTVLTRYVLPASLGAVDKITERLTRLRQERKERPPAAPTFAEEMQKYMDRVDIRACRSRIAPARSDAMKELLSIDERKSMQMRKIQLFFILFGQEALDDDENVARVQSAVRQLDEACHDLACESLVDFWRQVQTYARSPSKQSKFRVMLSQAVRVMLDTFREEEGIVRATGFIERLGNVCASINVSISTPRVTDVMKDVYQMAQRFGVQFV